VVTIKSGTVLLSNKTKSLEYTGETRKLEYRAKVNLFNLKVETNI